MGRKHPALTEGLRVTDEPTSSEAGPSEFQRNDDDDDLDLLTYNEARVRLSDELRTAEGRLVGIRQRLAGDGGAQVADDDVQACEHRVAALRDALDRAMRPAITPASAATFYGHRADSEQP